MRREVDRRILPSSVDFDIKFQPIAFLQIAHARTLNRADVHERIGLPVIAGDKAEALHRVEELDRSGSLFASQLALRSFGARGHFDHITDYDEIARRNLAATINQREFKLLTFAKPFEPGALNRADVHEHIFAAIIALNEAKALLAVEKLYDPGALANDLSGHSAPVTATAAAAARAAEAATTTAAAKAAATTAAAVAAATAAAVTAATAATAAEAAPITAAIAAAATAEPVAATAAATERIEIVFAKTVALVAAPAATSSIETHKTERTLPSPCENRLGSAGETLRTTGQMHRWHGPLHLG
jgi:hypothetical protein